MESPSLAQRVDAAIQAARRDDGTLDVEAAWRALGFTDEEVSRLAAASA